MSDERKTRLGERIDDELTVLRERAQFRTLENPIGVNLYSNDYLALASDPRLKRAVCEAVEAAKSIGSTGSRLLSGNSREWEDVEAEFADFAGTEAALYFGSGYAANAGLIGAIAGRSDVVFSDAFNHASLIDGIRLSSASKVIYRHGDLDFLEASLRKYRDHPNAKLIVTESVFSMEGDIAPIARLVEIAREYGAEVIVDEAHATGAHGLQGRGICAALGLEREIFAIVHTCGKALASAGAFVCGSRKLRDYLINRARTFIFSTAMPPYMAGQIRAALELVRGAEDRRTHLRTISEELRRRLSAAGMAIGASESQIVPLCLGGNEAALFVAARLQDVGFAVRAIRPPTVPEGTSRIRFSLTAALSMGEIFRLAIATEEAVRSAQLSPASVHV